MEKAKRGRKPVADKKKIVGIYLRQSEIIALGGPCAIREKFSQFLKTQQS